MELLPRLITTELAADEEATALSELLDQFARSKTEVLAVVTALGPFLTSSVDGHRAKAVALLAQVSGVRSCGDHSLLPPVVKSSGLLGRTASQGGLCGRPKPGWLCADC